MAKAGIQGTLQRKRSHHPPGSHRRPSPRSGQARVHRDRAEPALGDGPDVRPDLGGRCLRVLHRRCVKPHDRRLASRAAHAHHDGARRDRMGRWSRGHHPTDSAGYRASTAQWHADRRARRPKPAKLAGNEPLCDCVQARLSGEFCRPDGTVAGPQTPACRRHPAQLPTLLRGPVEPKQFTSIRYGERLSEIGAVPSIRAVGDSRTTPWLRQSMATRRQSRSAAPPAQAPARPWKKSRIATLGWVHWNNTAHLHG